MSVKGSYTFVLMTAACVCMVILIHVLFHQPFIRKLKRTDVNFVSELKDTTSLKFNAQNKVLNETSAEFIVSTTTYNASTSDDHIKEVDSIGEEMKKFGWKDFCINNLRNDLSFAKYADKIGVKNIVRKKNLNIKIPKTYAAVSNASDISHEMIQSLPAEYVFKANHGSAMTVVAKNNSFRCFGKFCARSNLTANSKILQLQFLKQTCHKWLSIDYGLLYSESFYSKINRQCFFEEMVPQNDTYKIHTFHGKPAIIEVTGKSSYKMLNKTFYTPTWQKINMIKDKSTPLGTFERPKLLKDMLNISKQLSRDFAFVRVDMYLGDDYIVFSELSLAPSACRKRFIPSVAERFYGSLAQGVNQDPEKILTLLPTMNPLKRTFNEGK